MHCHCSLNTSKKLQEKLIRNKAEQVETYLNVINQGAQWLSEHVLKQAAEDMDFCFLCEDTVKLNMVEKCWQSNKLSDVQQMNGKNEK
jgi:hypothetical protein